MKVRPFLLLKGRLHAAYPLEGATRAPVIALTQHQETAYTILEHSGSGSAVQTEVTKG
jgi:hypothetical protein